MERSADSRRESGEDRTTAACPLFGNSIGMNAAAPRCVMFAGTANCTSARTVGINRLSKC